MTLAYSITDEGGWRRRGRLEPLPAKSRRHARPIFDDARAGSRRIRAWSDLTAVVTEFHSGDDLETRYVADHAMLFVILEEIGGRVHGVCQQIDSKVLPATRNRMFLIPGNVQFVQYFDKSTSYVRQICLHLGAGGGRSQANSWAEPANPIDTKLGFCDQHLLGLARLFEAECGSCAVADPQFGESLTTGLRSALRGLPARLKPTAIMGGLTPRHMKVITEYIERHLAHPICSKDLAGLVQLSSSHFCKAFKTSTGFSPHVWLTQVRVRKAQELLTTGTCSLAEIAIETGFADQPHFSRVFAKLVGESPGAWRRRWRLERFQAICARPARNSAVAQLAS